jgi:hypothetical protein
MPIDPASGGSSNLHLYTHEEQGGGPPHSPAEQSPASSFNEGSPRGSTSSLAESLGADYGPASANSNYDPSKIQRGIINAALRGTPIENPEKVSAGITLHANLKESPNIDADEEPQGSQNPESSKGPLAQAAGNVLKKGTNLVHRVSLLRSNPTAPKQSPTELDAKMREREVANRQRGLIDIQDDPEEMETLQRSLGINRQKPDGTWE